MNENEECHYLQTCCDPENIITQEESQKIIETGINEDTMNQCIQQCKASEAPSHKNANIKISQTHEPLNGCGFRNRKGLGFQVFEQNARVAQFGEFPWHLSIQEKTDSNMKYICGASLIHPKVALTSAHCVHNKIPQNLVIRAGEWDTQTTNEPYPHSDYEVSRSIIHPEFNSANMANDIALVVMDHPVKLSAHINTICLPPQNSKFDHRTCVAAGWGRDNFHDVNAYRVNLKKRELPVVPLPECQEKLRKTKLGNRFKLNPTFMCAGGEKDEDTCVGE